MRLQLDGREIDLHSPNQLMAHLGHLRQQARAVLRIEMDESGCIWLEKDGERATVRYRGAGRPQTFEAFSDDDEDGGVPLVLAYQAVVHFLRGDGMTAALEWQQTAEAA